MNAPVRPTKVNLGAGAARVPELWSPRVIAEAAGVVFKLARLEGEFVWHAHPDADEVFLVLSGELQVEFVDGIERLGPGELLVVPRGVEHVTRAAGECRVLIVEPRGVVNTGDAGGPLTSPVDAWI